MGKWKALLADRWLRMSAPFKSLNPNAVLVFGCPKSGTSAIGSLMAKSADLDATIDIPTLWRTPARDVLEGRITAAQLLRQHKPYFSKGLVKEPGLTLIMPEVVEAMKASRVVFVVRDPFETIRSILQRRNVPGDLETLTPAQRERVHSGHWHWVYDWPYRYQPRQPAWLEGRQYVEGLATYWQWTVEAHRRTVDAGFNVEVVRYGDFLRDKQGEIESTLRRLGLEPVHDISEFVDVSYQPKGDHSMTLEEFFGGRNMERIATITEDGRSFFNYS